MSTITKHFKYSKEEGTYYHLLRSYKKRLINGNLSEEIEVSFTGNYSNLNGFTISLIEVTDWETANQLGVTELGYYVKAVCQKKILQDLREMLAVDLFNPNPAIK